MSVIAKFLNESTVETQTTNSDPKFIGHVITMMLAFGIFMPSAVLASVYKSTSNTWYYVHVCFNITGLVLACCGFILGISLAEDGSFDQIHPILGLTTMALVLLQPVNAAIRPHYVIDEHKSTKRLVWEWYHKIMGRIVLMISSITIGFGIEYAYELEYYNQNTYLLFTLLYSIYSTMIGMAIVLPELYRCCHSSIRKVNIAIDDS